MDATAGAPLRVAIVGPLPPPAGGMAMQTRQLFELLRGDGVAVTLVPVNPPYRPRWAANVRGLRAVLRLGPYLVRLRRIARQVDVFHVMANSGWSWHLFAAPAVLIGKLSGIRVIVNYRGGDAERFLNRSLPFVRRMLLSADLVAVPSGFLEQVLGRFGVATRVIPNIIDLSLFHPDSATRAAEARDTGRRARSPHLLVARNLEAIYDVPTALRAFAELRGSAPGARLTIAGSGPELGSLESLAQRLGIGDAVTFAGRLEREAMASLYRSADVVVNPSRVDNMPNSVLEALACGVPVVSTNVGGIPFLLEDAVTAVLVRAGDAAGMALAIRRVLEDGALAERLVTNGLALAQGFSWENVRYAWMAAYRASSEQASPDRRAGATAERG